MAKRARPVRCPWCGGSLKKLRLDVYLCRRCARVWLIHEVKA